jgi:TonB-linked SusC/RagA family outer membrane protein
MDLTNLPLVKGVAKSLGILTTQPGHLTAKLINKASAFRSQLSRSAGAKTIWRVMKLTSFLILCACLHVAAAGHAQRVSLSVKEAPLKTVFLELNKQTGYNFLYSDEILAGASKVTLNVRDATIEEVLTLSFRNQPLEFTVSNNTIVIRQKATAVFQPADNISQPPPIDITGKVTDSDGNPLSGATVKVKGTSKGTTTNNDGVFVLKAVDEDATLEISFVGYETYTVAVANKTSIIASLKIKPENLNEVVINKGYYTEKQRETVGNVATVTSKDIENQPVNNPLLALQGRVPGIEITQLTGMPGGGVTVRIQGINSIQSGLEPFIVIDGVPFPSRLQTSLLEGIVQNGSPLNYVNPNDIETIDVLKDADATAIYGSRAANGAILITTKKGKAGKTKLNVNLQQGWGKVGHFVDMMNTRQYLDMRYEAFKNDSKSPRPSDYDLTLWDTTRGTDWQKTLIGGTAQYTNINASISGGSSIFQYLVGGTFNRQTTVFPGGFDDKKGGLHFNITSNSTNKKFKLSLSGSYMYDRNQLPGTDLTQYALTLAPNAPTLYDKNGVLNWAPDPAGSSTWDNPLAYSQSMGYNNITKNLVSNLNIGYEFLQGVGIRANIGYTNTTSDLFSPTYLEANRPEDRPFSQRTASYGSRNIEAWITEPQIYFAKRFGKGKLDALTGYSIQQSKSNVLSLNGTGYSTNLLMKTLQAAQSITVGVSSTSESKFNGAFGRLNYVYNEKYIVNLTARRDGSSKFGDANKIHNFWSTGIAWIFSKEKCLRAHLPILSFGKLRTSYGTTGNDQIGDFGHLSLYSIDNPSLLYQNTVGLQPTNIPNPHLQWEETKKWQSGIDLGFLNNRISLSTTYARNRSSNQLIAYVIPSTTGFTSITQNLPALIQNTSWELSMNSVNVKGKKFTWSTNFNLTIPRNKLISFPSIEKTPYASGNGGVIVGQSIGVIKAYPFAGVDPATGSYQYYDNNGHLTLKPNYNKDRTVLISNPTKLYGGIQNSISYGAFQLDIGLQFVRQKGSRDMYYFNGFNAGNNPGVFVSGGITNQPLTVLNRWQKAGDEESIGRFSTIRYNLNIPAVTFSDAWYSYEASFIRLKNLSISWLFPTNWIQKLKMQSVRVYVRGENLFTITKYHGLDPESRSVSSLPPLRLITTGLQIEL